MGQLRNVAWIAATAMAAVLGCVAAGQAKADVKIGVLTDMSAQNADLGGTGSVEAARMAIEEMGGKVLGQPIDLLSADMQSKADISNAIARKWYESDGVDVITDINNSSSAIAINHLAAKLHRIDIVSQAASTRLTAEDCTPYSVHYNYDTYMLSSATTMAVMKQGGGTWYDIVVDYAYGQDMEKQIDKLLSQRGGKVVGVSLYPPATEDFSSYLLKAQASKAKVIALLNSGQELISSVKQANEFGVLQGGQILVGMSVEISDIDAIGLDTAQGLTFTSSFYWDQNPTAAAWSKKFLQRTGKMPTTVQAAVYSAVRHYLQAVDAAGSKDADLVMKKMKEMPIEDAFASNGKIREDGLMVHDVLLTQVKTPKESSGRWDYLKILQRIPGDDVFEPIGGCKPATK